jgi:LemA protein
MAKWIVLGIFGLFFFFFLILLAVGVGSYNGLVRQSQAVDSQWAQVQNVYQRRADLVPNLVSTVAGAANFEKSTLVEVTDARASVGRVTLDQSHAPDDAAKLQQYQQAQGQLGTALSHLMVVSENYPDLKATANFTELQAQLEGTENRISTERERFNTVTRDYDTSVHSFPDVLFAGMFGFHDKPYFAAETTAQTAPTVNFPKF